MHAPTDSLDASTTDAERFHALFRGSRFAVLNVDADGRILDANSAAERFFGRNAEEIRRAGFRGLTHPDDFNAAREEAARVCGGESESVEWEHRFLRPDGSVVWGELCLTAVGAGRGAVAMITDVTERRRAEEARLRVDEQLRGREAELRAIVESSPDVIARLDVRRRHVYVSPRIGDTGLAPEFFLGKTHEEIAAELGIGERFGDEWRDALVRVMESGTAETAVFRFPGRREMRVWQCRLAPLWDESGALDGVLAIARDVTEQHETETELRESEERFRLLVEGDPRLMFYTHDLGGAFTYVSPSTERILGYAPDELIGRRSRFLHADEAASRFAEENTAEAYGRGAAISPYTLHVRKKDGTRVYLEITESPILVDDVPVGMRGFARDVTEEKADREALYYAHQKLRLHMERSPLGFVQTDPAGYVVDWNPAAEEILGYTRDEIVGQHFSVFVPEPLREPVRSLLAGLAHGNGFGKSTNENVRKDGGVIIGEWVNTALIDPNGELVGFASTLRDVTAEREANQRLQEAEAHYRRLVETSPFGIYVLDTEGRIVDVNGAAAAVVGLRPEELVGRHFGALVDAESIDASRESFRELSSGVKETTQMEVWIRRPDGARRLVMIHASPIREGDRIVGTQGVTQDITEEREQHVQMQMLHAILERLPDEGVSITTMTGEILYSNAAHARILGYDHDNPPPEGIRAFLPPGDDALSEIQELQRALKEQGSWTSHARRRRLSDGEVRTVRLITGRVPGPHHDLVFSVLVDATERLEREAQLRRAERLASVGTLVGGVAHELNNPLAAIKGFATLLTQTEDLGQIREWIGIIHREADRAARIVADLTLVARSTQERKSEKRPISLDDIIRHVLRVQDYRLRTHNVEVVMELDPDLPPVLADQAQMEQVVTNLVVNAQQALSTVPGKRQLRVRTGRSSRGAVLHVGDTGPGIPPDKLDRIFDPFFSTKAPGEGTGLGLSLVHSIVTEHGGEIHVESTPGRGADFRVTIPIAVAPPRRAVEAPTGGGRERLRILVVDDEAPIRMLLRIALSQRGHTVEEAADGADALERIATSGGAYDVIVSDLRMPGFGGDQLLRRVEALMPRMARRLIFVTGDAATEAASGALAGRDNPVLVKPFDIATATEAIERHARDSRGE